MKKIIYIIISLAALASAAIYLYFDGLIPYIIQRSITPPIKLIEYYSGIEFPSETEIENVTFYSYDDPNTDDPSGGVFEATLIVTSDLIDDLFPKKTRKYSEFYMSFIPENDQPDYDFTVTKTRVVRRYT